MLSAVSGPISQAAERLLGTNAEPVQAATPSDWRSDWFVFMVADISDETAAEITKAEAWPAFTAFFRLLWKRQREAEKAKLEKAVAACQAGVLLDEGVRGLARSIGLSPKAMNRQIGELHRLGILAVAKPPASVDRDQKGRMVRRPAHRGRVPAAKIRFTAGDPHRRPTNRQGSNRPLKVVGLEGAQGSNRPLRGGRSKGRNDTTSISPKNISPSAGGQADGIGRPAEERRTAAEAAAAWIQEDPRMVAMRQEYLAAQERKRREQLEAKAARQQAPRNATEAAANLQAAVDQLPPASRQKAKREAKRMTKEERQAEKDAAALNRIIEEQKQRDGTAGTAAASAIQTDARSAWRKRRTRKAVMA